MLTRLGFPAIGRHRRFVSATGIDAVGSGVWMPISVLYFLATTDLRLVQVGLALSLASALTMPLAVVAGQVVDRYGAKRVMQGGNVLQALGFAAYPFAHSLVAVTLVVAVAATGRTAFWGSFGPMVAAIAEPGERETWFGFLGALRNSGFAIGGLLAGVALTVGTGAAYQTVVVLNALSFVASFVLLLGVVVHDPGLHAERPVGGWATVVRDRGYRWLVITNFAYAMVGLALNLAIPVYLVGLGLPGWLTGAVFVLNTVLIGIGQGLVVRAMTGVVRTRIITASAGFAVVSFALLWLVGLLPAWAGVAVTLVAAVVYTLNELAGGPVLATLASEAPPVELRGRYQAAYQLSWNGASALAPLLFAWLLGIGSLAIWGVLAGIALVGAACCVPMARSLPLASRAVTNAAYDPAL